MQSGAAGLASAKRGIAWALAAAVLETHFVLPWKLAAQSGSANAAVLVMLSCAALFSTVALPWTQRMPGYRAGPLGRREWVLAAQLALLTLLGNWASAHAIARLSPSLLTVLMRSEVLLVALLALVLLGERVERRFWIGAVIAAAGLCVIQGIGGSVRIETLWGPLAALTAAASFGTMTVITRRVIREIDPVRVNMLRLWLSVALWFAVNGAPPALAELTPRLVGFAALAALCGPFASRLCLMFSGRYVDARMTAIVGLSAPVMTLFAAWLALGDWPAPRELLGGAIMLLGIAVPISGWVRGARPLAQPEARRAGSARA